MMKNLTADDSRKIKTYNSKKGTYAIQSFP